MHPSVSNQGNILPGQQQTEIPAAKTTLYSSHLLPPSSDVSLQEMCELTRSTCLLGERGGISSSWAWPSSRSDHWTINTTDVQDGLVSGTLLSITQAFTDPHSA